jgi:hypothetical protein
VAQALIARIDALEGKTTDADPDPEGTPTGDEDAEEDKKVTGDAAFKRNIIADAEIICPASSLTATKVLSARC